MNKPIFKSKHTTIYSGNNLDVLPTLPANSVDSIVCDPPYELGFMGKTWDNSGIAYSVELWQECLRVLKPGGYLLAFGGSRTWHRLAVAVEDAGFEIRDSIAWLYGSGFPKSHNISKAIDKLQGTEVKVGKAFKVAGEYSNRNLRDPETQGANRDEMRHTAETEDAIKWQGWGTALKPAHEPIVVARKPLIGTVAENVLTYGTGGINIDATRVGNEQITINTFDNGAKPWGDAVGEPFTSRTSVGRWPANIILDETTAELLDEQAPQTGAFAKVKTGHDGSSHGIYGDYSQRGDDGATFYDDGLVGASRFFYVAKASKKDRNEGLDELPEKQTTGGGGGVGDYLEDVNSASGKYGSEKTPAKNFHPTVKPTLLMQYLIRLVTPENGVVLDPFCGSGSTGKAAILENKNFIGIELTNDYLPIIIGRLEHAEQQHLEKVDDLFE
jgi:site-specific DNA-methyltransferase (adenine-specific)